jgi:hypothetical protein
MHKLVIEEKFDSQWVWYKDEPKTEKYYVIQVSLQDSQGNNILDRKFPILPLLTYSNKQPVPNQSNILQVNEAESRLFIDSKPGSSHTRTHSPLTHSPLTHSPLTHSPLTHSPLTHSLTHSYY